MPYVACINSNSSYSRYTHAYGTSSHTIRVYGRTARIRIRYIVPYKTKVWREKSLVNLANFTKSPNFIRQTSYNSTTIVSILTFSPNFIRQIDCFTCFAKLLSYTVYSTVYHTRTV